MTMEEVLQSKIYKLETERGLMIQYTHSKINTGDIHAAQDALMDIRDIDAQLVVYRETQGILRQALQ